MEERGVNDKVKGTFSLKFAINKISREKDLVISDDNINEICTFITNEDIINTKAFFENMNKKNNKK